MGLRGLLDFKVRSCSLSSRKRTFALQNRCPLWVISGHLQCKTPCPLYVQKRTFAAHKRMSAKCQ